MRTNDGSETSGITEGGREGRKAEEYKARGRRGGKRRREGKKEREEERRRGPLTHAGCCAWRPLLGPRWACFS